MEEIVDTISAYEQARKRARRAYNLKVSLGRSGNLPYLDELLSNVEIVNKEVLGNFDLPLKKIIGTYSSGRSTAFAYNFMPLLAPDTEFAMKWRSLYRHQVTDGITDPIKVYEYLNRYYVVEGNKRVSVMRFFDASTISADVTRLIPKYDENDETIRQYYEFLEFYREFKLSNIWTKSPGGFRQMAQMIRSIRLPDGETEADRGRYFMDNYYTPFRSLLYEMGGDRMGLSTGDVFLRYFTLYHIPAEITEERVKAKLEKLCEELRTSIGYEDVDLQIKPETTEPPSSLLSAIINIVKPRQKLKIAFAYSGKLEESNWTKAHENGRMHVQQALDNDVQTTYLQGVAEDLSAYAAFKALITQGYHVIFATSPAFAHGALKAALEFPQARIFVCSELMPSRHMHTYFGRIYEPRFLTGLIAGSLTRSNIIGYVGSYPVRGVISGVNAFALGVRTVNPKARVLVNWACHWEEPHPPTSRSRELMAAGADIISHQNTFTGVGFEGEYGLYSLECENPDCGVGQYIATPVWHWGVFYEKAVRNLLASGTGEDYKPMQFWWGLDSGIVDVMYAKKYVPLETHKLVQMFKRMMMEDAYNPFTGSILDVDGLERLHDGETASVQDIIGMDWFVHGLEGDLNVDSLPTDITSGLLEM